METFRTLAEAREARRARGSQVASGEFSPAARATLHDYARQWMERYQGTGRRGFREETRAEYSALLERFALRYFPPSLRLSEIAPRDVADFVGWLAKQPTRRGGSLADASVRTAFKPLSVCLATARREGLIRHNPAFGAMLPHRPRVEEDEERVRPFPTGPWSWWWTSYTPATASCSSCLRRPGCGDQSYWRSKAAIFTLAAEARL